MIELPFPSSLLAGQNNKHFWKIRPVTNAHRELAREAAKAAGIVAPEGVSDIRVAVTFYPPNRRGDRVNFPNRMKPYWDGIADALKVNDSRFLPSYHFAEPVKGEGKVVVVVG